MFIKDFINEIIGSILPEGIDTKIPVWLFAVAMFICAVASFMIGVYGCYDHYVLNSTRDGVSWVIDLLVK